MEKIKLFFTLSFFSIITAGYYNNYYNPPIIVATVCGDLSKVKSYCTASTINAKGNSGQTALMHSCISNSGDIFVFLMENNADFKIKDNFSKTALDYAIEHNRVEMIEYLALSGADTNGLDVDEVLKDAHKKIKTQEFITEIKKSYPDLDKIRLCIAGGVDVNAKDNDGWTALIYAANNGQTKIAKLLIAAGSDVNAKDNMYCCTALMEAVYRGHTETVKLLIAAGADVNAGDKFGWTALMNAARNNNTEVAKLLIAAGANVNAGDKFGWTALINAAHYGHIETAKLLIAADADINARDKFSCTALLWASKYGYIEFAKILIAAGADVNAKGNHNWTALMWASKYGYIEFAKILIAAGADVNTKNNYIGWTSLMLAVQNGHIGLANLLIDSGAKVSISLIFKINHPNLYKTAVIGSATILGLGINYLIKRL